MGRLPDEVLAVLCCPVCRLPLARADAAVRCPDRHSFDVARQGYLNLITGRVPTGSADTAEMVAARVDFLAAGHYAPLAQLLADAATAHAPTADGLVADAGAGIGYYLGALLDRRPAALGLAMDLSPLALRRAARVHPALGAVGWDVWRPWPVRDEAATVLLNVFAPRNGPEFHRVLRRDGVLLVVTPGPDHLAELGAEAGLLGVDPDKDRRLTATLGDRFRLTARESRTVPLALSPVDVWRVVHMGPAGHHRSDPRPEPDAAAEPVSVTASFVLSVFRPVRSSTGLPS